MNPTYKKITKIIFMICVFVSTTHTTYASTQYCGVLQRSILTNTIPTNTETDVLVQALASEDIVVTRKKQDIFRGVRLLQKKYGLEVVGTVGPKTRAKINEITTRLCQKNTATTTVSSMSTTTNTVGTSTSTQAMTGPYFANPLVLGGADVEPSTVEVTSPNGGESFEQGFGRDMYIRWISKNIHQDQMVTIDLLNENMETVAETWKSKNTGLFTLNYTKADDLPIGFFYIRVRYYCNSEKIPCAEDLSDTTFPIYPPTGWFANFFHFDAFKTGEKKILSSSQSFTVNWFPYTKDFSYYRVYLGNVILNKEVFVGSTGSSGQRIQEMDLKNLKKDTNKPEKDIQNAFYIKVQAVKRSSNNSPDTVVKEIISSQFPIR